MNAPTACVAYSSCNISQFLFNGRHRVLSSYTLTVNRTRKDSGPNVDKDLISMKSMAVTPIARLIRINHATFNHS